MSTSSYADDLRALAAWFDAHPEIRGPRELMVYAEDTKDEVRRTAKAMGSFTKRFSASTLTLEKRFGEITLEIMFWRSAVCTRKVVGTETVQEAITDPNAPKIIVQRVREIEEWECEPLMGITQDGETQDA